MVNSDLSGDVQRLVLRRRELRLLVEAEGHLLVKPQVDIQRGCMDLLIVLHQANAANLRLHSRDDSAACGPRQARAGIHPGVDFG